MSPPKSPDRKSTQRKAAIGMDLVSLAVHRELEWLFRPQPLHDFGIDGHIETMTVGVATGRLIAVQVKCGPSYFRKATVEGWLYRGDNAHLAYWLNHSLPVVVVLVDHQTGECYFQRVRKEVVTAGNSGWTMSIPRTQRLTGKNKVMLARMAEGGLRRLYLERPWMEVIAGGGRVLLEVEEWVNKTSGRADTRLIYETADGEEQPDASWIFFIPGSIPYEEAFLTLFPWAEVTIDEDFYMDHDEDQWDLETRIWGSDEDGDDAFHSEEFSEWLEHQPDGLRPYSSNGEVASWRFELGLNNLGRSFLIVARFVDGVESVG